MRADDEDDDDGDDLAAIEALRGVDYAFDKDPFINALEKKLRRLGRIASKEECTSRACSHN